MNGIHFGSIVKKTIIALFSFGAVLAIAACDAEPDQKVTSAPAPAQPVVTEPPATDITPGGEVYWSGDAEVSVDENLVTITDGSAEKYQVATWLAPDISFENPLEIVAKLQPSAFAGHSTIRLGYDAASGDKIKNDIAFNLADMVIQMRRGEGEVSIQNAGDLIEVTAKILLPTDASNIYIQIYPAVGEEYWQESPAAEADLRLHSLTVK